jgi:regulator of nucleoside diphosphate kinase
VTHFCLTIEMTHSDRGGLPMRRESSAMKGERHIVITGDDMARLRELVRPGRRASRRDQGHLAELDRELDRAEIIGAEDLSPDVVTMHSTVRVLDLDRGASAVYTLVFPSEADIEKRRISVLAPIGTALIGYRAGDRVEWPTPGGGKRFRIEEVLFQPEAAADGAAVGGG